MSGKLDMVMQMWFEKYYSQTFEKEGDMQYASIYHERLCRLLQVAEGVRQEQFDLMYWIKEENTPDGMIGCMSAHAACDPWFIAQGFKLVKIEDELTVVFEGDADKCGGYTEWDALEVFFNLDNLTSSRLFDIFTYEDLPISREKFIHNLHDVIVELYGYVTRIPKNSIDLSPSNLFFSLGTE